MEFKKRMLALELFAQFVEAFKHFKTHCVLAGSEGDEEDELELVLLGSAVHHVVLSYRH
jgi:hypothetical protein